MHMKVIFVALLRKVLVPFRRCATEFTSNIRRLASTKFKLVQHFFYLKYKILAFARIPCVLPGYYLYLSKILVRSV